MNTARTCPASGSSMGSAFGYDPGERIRCRGCKATVDLTDDCLVPEHTTDFHHPGCRSDGLEWWCVWDCQHRIKAEDNGD